MNTSETVWPVENYTDKIHSGIYIMFEQKPWLTFTVNQMKEHLIRGYSWLTIETPYKEKLLEKIILTGIKKHIQSGRVQRVESKVSIDPQWMCKKGVENSSYVNITSQDDVAVTRIAKRLVSRRAVSPMKLWRLNKVKDFID